MAGVKPPREVAPVLISARMVMACASWPRGRWGSVMGITVYPDAV